MQQFQSVLPDDVVCTEEGTGVLGKNAGMGREIHIGSQADAFAVSGEDGGFFHKAVSHTMCCVFIIRFRDRRIKCYCTPEDGKNEETALYPRHQKKKIQVLQNTVQI